MYSHPDIRRAFNGFHMMGLDIKYGLGAVHGDVQASRELVITNWNAAESGDLF